MPLYIPFMYYLFKAMRISGPTRMTEMIRMEDLNSQVLYGLKKYKEIKYLIVKKVYCQRTVLPISLPPYQMREIGMPTTAQRTVH